jgi:hypothetical protein
MLCRHHLLLVVLALCVCVCVCVCVCEFVEYQVVVETLDTGLELPRSFYQHGLRLLV